MGGVKAFTKWFLTTATVVGVPTLTILLLVGIQRMCFTVSCHGWGSNCESAFRASNAKAAITDILDEYPDYDVAMKPKKK